jgi:hypothetical protein
MSNIESDTQKKPRVVFLVRDISPNNESDYL